jgi:hypothetical protein
MVSAALDDYLKADTRFEKSLVVHKIVDHIRAEGGRFLKKDNREGRWYELTQQRSKEKVGHAVRDAANLHESKLKKEKEGRTAALSAEVAPLPLGGEAKLPGYDSDATSSTGRGSKRSAHSGLETQRKRRRTTASPHHLPAEDALRSAAALAATIPRNLKRSPISISQSQHDFPGTGVDYATDPMGGMVANLPSSLRRSPIEQHQSHLRHAMGQQHYGMMPQSDQQLNPGELQQQQQQHFRTSLPGYSSHLSQYPLQQQQPHHLQRRSSMPTMFETMQFGSSGSPMLQQQPQYPPSSFPQAPHVIAATEAGMSHPQNTFASTHEAFSMQGASLPSGAIPRAPDMMLPNPNVMDPVRLQMFQQMQRERYFQQAQFQQNPLSQRQQQQMYHSMSGRVDENDHFLAAIDAALGPLQQDVDASFSLEGYAEGAAPAPALNDPQQQYIQRLQQRMQERQRQRTGEADDEDTQGDPSRQPDL